jgi:hypothetical protein
VRKLIAVGAAGVLVLAVAALAIAKVGTGRNHKFDLTYTAEKPKKPTGIHLLSDRFTYQPPPPGQSANPVTELNLTLAAGTKTNVSAVPRCDKADLESQGPNGCPNGSNVGGGKATVITGLSAIDPVQENVEIFASDDVDTQTSGDQAGVLLYLTGLQTATLPATLKGRKLVAKVPKFCLPGDDTATPQCDNGEAVLTKADVKIKKRSSGRGRNRKHLIRTPGACPRSRKWKSKIVYKYRSGPNETVTSTSACTKR